MNQTENPLDQLRDIQLPAAIEQWQLAPGWWFLIVLFASLLVYLIYRWFRRKAALVLLKPVLDELNKISALAPQSEAVAQLSALIKRVCLVYYPQNKVASLTGKPWLVFLNEQLDQPVFDGEAELIFSEVAYRQNYEVEQDRWQKLIQQSERFLQQVIRQESQRGTR